MENTCSFVLIAFGRKTSWFRLRRHHWRSLPSDLVFSNSSTNRLWFPNCFFFSTAFRVWPKVRKTGTVSEWNKVTICIEFCFSHELTGTLNPNYQILFHFDSIAKIASLSTPHETNVWPAPQNMTLVMGKLKQKQEADKIGHGSPSPKFELTGCVDPRMTLDTQLASCFEMDSFLIGFAGPNTRIEFPWENSQVMSELLHWCPFKCAKQNILNGPVPVMTYFFPSSALLEKLNLVSIACGFYVVCVCANLFCVVPIFFLENVLIFSDGFMGGGFPMLYRYLLHCVDEKRF